MSLTDAFAQLRQMVDEAEDDVKKADGGNKAAGTRVRKKMQEIKNFSPRTSARQVLEGRGDEDAPKAPSPS